VPVSPYLAEVKTRVEIWGCAPTTPMRISLREFVKRVARAMRRVYVEPGHLGNGLTLRKAEP
jgi:hypothetical protein